MSAEIGGGTEIPNWLVTIGASAVTAAGAFVLGLINRGPAMQAAITTATQTLIAGYEKRVDDLTAEVHNLRAEIVDLRKALNGRPEKEPI